MAAPSRRLDDHIRTLCARIAASDNGDEWIGLLPELQTTVHEAIARLRFRLLAVFDGPVSKHPERRKIPDSR
jgi:hypothetical protein